MQERDEKGRFVKGSVPPNKGKPPEKWLTKEGIENSKKTRFKKGNIPPNKGKHPEEWMTEEGYKRFKCSQFKKGHEPWNYKEKVIKICEYCGKKFEVHPYRKDVAKFCSRKCKNESQKGRLKHDKPRIDKNILEELYLEERLSPKEIGNKFGVTPQTVRYWMEKQGIPRRTISEIQKGKPRPERRKLNISKDELRKIYWIDGLNSREIAEKFNVSESTVLVWMKKYKIPKRSRSEIQKKKKITIICNNCGKKFKVNPYRKDTAKYCSRTCAFAGRFKINIPKEKLKRLYWIDNLTLEEIGNLFNVSRDIIAYQMERYDIPRRHKGHNGWNKGKTKETDKRVRRAAEKLSKLKISKDELIDLYHTQKLNLSEIAKKFNVCNATVYNLMVKYDIPRRTHSEIHKGKKRQDISKLMYELWRDKESVRRRMKSMHRHPNKPEKQMSGILNRNFPGEFGYNGNFELGIMIGGLIPDFPNVNGRKKIIEVFGDYWHDAKRRENLQWFRQEWGRKAYYSQFGWDCLIIWEHELKELPEEEIVEKIRRFTNE